MTNWKMQDYQKDKLVVQNRLLNVCCSTHMETLHVLEMLLLAKVTLKDDEKALVKELKAVCVNMERQMGMMVNRIEALLNPA